MSPKLEIVRTVISLRKRIALWRETGQRIGLVPTMGALHGGHFSLVKFSLEFADKTIVTLFVNPKQFGPNEDLNIYPKDETKDFEALEKLGADLVFVPEIEEMYPDGSITTISLPGIGDLLEGEFRPGFFDGVATVVCKLLVQTFPDYAFFGEKDFQQLAIIKQMAKDLDLPVEIIGCPTIRESDGLALSSRNAYLSSDERKIAPAFYDVLNQMLEKILAGEPIKETIEGAKLRLFEEGFSKIDYIVVCESSSLEDINYLGNGGHILGAVWLGKTRLIDNIKIKSS